MKKTKLLVAFLSLGLMGTLGIGVVKATAVVTPLEWVVVEYTLNSWFSTLQEQYFPTPQVFSAWVLEISWEDTKIYILDRILY